jgi:hypothetical protein
LDALVDALDQSRSQAGASSAVEDLFTSLSEELADVRRWSENP